MYKDFHLTCSMLLLYLVMIFTAYRLYANYNAPSETARFVFSGVCLLLGLFVCKFIRENEKCRRKAFSISAMFLIFLGHAAKFWTGSMSLVTGIQKMQQNAAT